MWKTEVQDRHLHILKEDKDVVIFIFRDESQALQVAMSITFEMLNQYPHQVIELLIAVHS